MTLARHFAEHGPDFGASSAEHYAQRASQFFQACQRALGLVAEDKPLFDPGALEALAAVVEGDVRSSRAAELREGADVLLAALASENDEQEGG